MVYCTYRGSNITFKKNIYINKARLTILKELKNIYNLARLAFWAAATSPPRRVVQRCYCLLGKKREILRSCYFPSKPSTGMNIYLSQNPEGSQKKVLF